MELRNTLKGADLTYAFPAKWHEIETAFYAALSSEQGVKRWSAHFSNGPSTFTCRSMEKAIHDIDVEVDKAYGTSDVNFKDSKNRSHNLVIHHLLTKYRLIFELAEQLPGDVKI